MKIHSEILEIRKTINNQGIVYDLNPNVMKLFLTLYFKSAKALKCSDKEVLKLS